MNIFNSLGSNYSWSFMTRALFTLGSKNTKNELKKHHIELRVEKPSPQ